MKKTSFAAVLALSLASSAHADRILGIYGGIGVWNTDLSGQAGEPSIGVKDLGVKAQTSNYYYVAIEHLVPLVPNVMLEYVNNSATQNAVIKQSFKLDDTTFKLNERVSSEFNLSHTDATFYYQILDNWVNLDVGLTARKYSGFVSATAEDLTTKASIHKKLNVDQVLPLLYGKAQFDLPLTGLSIGVQGNYINVDKDELSDFSAKVSYLFGSVAQAGVEVGYRKTSLTLDHNGLKGTLDLDGPYAALIAHF